jgi:hypothetical protein
MIRSSRVAILVLALLAAGVAHPDPPVADAVYRFNFDNGSLGWSGDFADYPAGEEEFYELNYGFARLPTQLADDRFALLLSGNNHSDDLCMFLRRKITGLEPNADYRVYFRVVIASNAPNDAIGVGGAPGESVFVKAGVSLERPAADPGTRLLNVDKGNQANGGADAVVLGHIGVNTPVDSPRYRFKRLDNFGDGFLFRTDDRGEAWLLFATDSGFEGTTRLFVVGYGAWFDRLP